jgi:type IV pilus assembly protein PilB
MTELGFEEDDLALFKQKIHLPVGIVLLTGPTGSGKSTTVYSAVTELNTSAVNICTAEDPIEMSIEGVNQVAANPQIDLTFSNILRSFLRQDPDIIFVGEIRDFETADISFKAASTGHLVISTLHTNDAPATIVRLTEMGVEPFLVGATVNLVVAQRLVGRICPNCKTDAKVAPEVLMNLGIPEEKISSIAPKKGEGCGECNNTGIRGRVAIHELMDINAPIREAILKGASSTELRKIAVANGMRSLRANAVMKMIRGLTTIEEVLSTTVKD